MAVGSAPDAPWDPPTNLSEVNSSQSEQPTWLSANGCRLYLQSDRATGDYNLYVATRPK